MPCLWPFSLDCFKASCSTGKVPLIWEANGISWICLCGTLMPESLPLLKNINDWRLYKTSAAACQSFLVNGASCFSASFVTTSTCSLQMGNLLNRSRWVLDRSAMKSPGSNGGKKGSKASFFLSLFSARVGFFASPSINRTSNGIPLSSKVSTEVPRNTMLELGSNCCVTRLFSSSQ